MWFLLFRAAKKTLGFLLAVGVAELAGLEFSLSAGVITLLMFLDPVRQSPRTAWQRVATAAAALLLSSLAFRTFGFNLAAFGGFLFLFVAGVLAARANAGLVVNTVLVTHVYALERADLPVLANEMGLMLVGVATALLLNLYMPSTERIIRELIGDLEGQLRAVLLHMGSQLENQCRLDTEQVSLEALEETIQRGKEKAEAFINSDYLHNRQYYLAYFRMREEQHNQLRHMCRHFDVIHVAREQGSVLARFTERLSAAIAEENSGEELLEEIGRLKAFFKTQPLPASREEFENRASLYQYLNDLEAFVSIKRRFVLGYRKEEA
ncbi:aromatic acid exporter family protein [Anaerotalea alkaliphila]|uniref:Putative aromatic acid exporter C-terminal domain-containing protein n=1 Tax=Anaerotalea alkaliphila TaxID=2662126 RepID=A0A7X5HW56_9FIRM|nr:aromatic acid exporter family protein [Anaerotalea alkaliphila]NDL67763.1 hypothetical protein [Anaerotalea alkaliphila]